MYDTTVGQFIGGRSGISKKMCVGMSFMVLLLCPQGMAQGVPKRAVAGTSVRVSHGKSEMDGEHWTILTVLAKETYQNMVGVTIRPELRVQCVQKGDDRKVSLILTIGPVDVNQLGGTALRIKLSGAEVFWYEFGQMSDHSSYKYWGRAVLGDSWYSGTFPQDKELLQPVVLSKTVLVEFEPLMVGNTTVAKFDVSGLRREFDKSLECKGSTAVLPAVTGNSQSRTPVPLAVTGNSQSSTLVLSDYAPVPPAAAPMLPAVTASLARVIERGDLGTLRTRLLIGANPNEPDDSVVKGWTPLMAAAYAGNLAATRLLLDSGATLDARTEFGETALDIAVRLDETEVATFLRNMAAKRSR
jgi:hypothetical protein